MSLTNQFSGTISVTDSASGSVALNLPVALQFIGTVFEYKNTQTIGTSPTSISLPATAIQFFYIQNTHATNTVTVTWTPNGGSSNIVLTLQPGSAQMFCEVNTSSGITALSLTASAANTTVKYILGA